MKILKYLFSILLFLPIVCKSQTNTENYVKTDIMLDETQNLKMSSVQYYDGLGFPTVSVTNAGGSGQTTYSMITYDASGRKLCEYLPAVASNGTLQYKTPEEVVGLSSDNKAFTKYHYDALNRVIATDIPGNKWEGKQNKVEYTFNVKGEVLHYEVHANINSLITPENASYMYYPAGTLTKETSIDADNKKIEVFKNSLGQTILQRSFRVVNSTSKSDTLDTYYVYDELGYLRHVLSPKYQTSGNKNYNGYEYRYDQKGRIVKKILPGCDYIQYWYDDNDRLICMQDPELRKIKKNRFYIYDCLGRLVIQGICTQCKQGGSVYTAKFENNPNSFKKADYYIPSEYLKDLANAEIEIINYYDNHLYINNPFYGYALSKKEYCSQKGQLTGIVSRTTTGEYVSALMAYDIKGNLIESVTRELDGKIVRSSNTYTFTNQLEKSTYDVNTETDGKLSVVQNYQYNRYNNKKEVSTLNICHGKFENSSRMTYSYNGLGQLVSISRPCSDAKYKYELHGWLENITTNSFTEDIFYASGKGTKYYNGNISSIKWTDNTSSKIRGYKFLYDGANRLTQGKYGEGDAITTEETDYSEKVSYDVSGNIIGLTRYGKVQSGYGIIDNLTVSYIKGNQLSKVKETAPDYDYEGSLEYKKANVSDKETQYWYNKNGSLIADKSRGISYIKYDLNNNPIIIYFANGSTTEYVYNAGGTKLRVIHKTAKPNVITREYGSEKQKSLTEDMILYSNTTDYLVGGQLILKNGEVSKYLFDGGYCQISRCYNFGGSKIMGPLEFEDADGNTIYVPTNVHQPQSSYSEDLEFFFYNQDHLGNIREVVDGKGNVIQTTNYYPFGSIFADASAVEGSSEQPYKYNAKEFDKMQGLNTYDYGARQYDPVLARWDRIDPHCESYYNTNPYAYANNNPIWFVDVDGKDWYSYRTPEGAIIYEWYDGSEDREGYTNEGATHTITNGNCTYTFEQNEMVSMTENVLNEGDWSSQMTEINKKITKKSPKATEGDCFYQSGIMVQKSGTTSLGGTANNINGNKRMQSYINSQIDRGYSVRVQVDRQSSKKKFDGQGDHWVAIASRTTDLRTGEESFQFYDPGTIRPAAGTSKDNSFKFNPASNCWTSPAYGSMKYNLLNVRKNQN